MTANGESSLARQADHLLLMPRAEEACPHGLAPTTSAVMQLALGDALAIALLEDARLHGAGLPACSIPAASSAPACISSPTSCAAAAIPLLVSRGERTDGGDAIAEMTAKRFGCIGIVDAARTAHRHRHRRRSPPPYRAGPAHPPGRGGDDAGAEDDPARHAGRHGDRPAQHDADHRLLRRRRRPPRRHPAHARPAQDRRRFTEADRPYAAITFSRAPSWATTRTWAPAGRSGPRRPSSDRRRGCGRAPRGSAPTTRRSSRPAPRR